MSESLSPKESSLKETDKLPTGKKFETKKFVVCAAVISLTYLLVVGWCYMQEEEDNVILIASIIAVVAIGVAAVMCYNTKASSRELTQLSGIENSKIKNTQKLENQLQSHNLSQSEDSSKMKSLKNNSLEVETLSEETLGFLNLIKSLNSKISSIKDNLIEKQVSSYVEHDKIGLNSEIIQQLNTKSQHIIGFKFSFQAVNHFITTSKFQYYMQIRTSFDALEKNNVTKDSHRLQAFKELEEQCKGYVDRIIDRVVYLMDIHRIKKDRREDNKNYSQFYTRLGPQAQELCGNTLEFFMGKTLYTDNPVIDDKNLILSKKNKEALGTIPKDTIIKLALGRLTGAKKTAMAVETIQEVTKQVQQLLEQKEIPKKDVTYQLSPLSMEYIVLHEELGTCNDNFEGVHVITRIAESYNNLINIQKNLQHIKNQVIKDALNQLINVGQQYTKQHLDYLDTVLSKELKSLKQPLPALCFLIGLHTSYLQYDIDINNELTLIDQCKMFIYQRDATDNLLTSVYTKIDELIQMWYKHVLPKYIQQGANVVKIYSKTLSLCLNNLPEGTNSWNHISLYDSPLINTKDEQLVKGLTNILIPSGLNELFHINSYDEDAYMRFSSDITNIQNAMKDNEDYKSWPEETREQYKTFIDALDELALLMIKG